ncbi:Kyphoscoliosis peptidase [Pseudocercospora fuligena]|uniref:Kyphoscoliosis peptidase n=1 Tax=Pseudocercospora fuligena TaxID=685502 RepID=A0A8H6R8Y7_9PEZI|nr:Kyphoscoliosis peptidase [Pseudocercospora fuligena]
MAEEPRATSIAERIAALKLQSAGNIPVNNNVPPAANKSSTAPSVQRPRPPPPPRPSVPSRPDRSQTSSVPPAADQVPTSNGIGNRPNGPTNGATNRPALPSRSSTQYGASPPPLPNRTPSDRPSPALPPRRPSEAPSQTGFDRSRRGSTDSQSSVATTRSSVSGISNATSYTSQGGPRVKAPEYNPAELPALPPKRTKEEKEAADRKYNGLRPALRSSTSTPKVSQVQQGTTPPPPVPRQQAVAPPPLPGRTNSIPQAQMLAIEAPRPQSRPELPARVPSVTVPAKAEPTLPAPPKRSALDFGMNKATNEAPQVPAARPVSSQPVNGAPPPIPTSSKPDLAALQASKPKLNGATAPAPAAPQAGPIAISSYAQFSQILSSHRIVVSDFYADWCGPCRNFAPDYERLSMEYSRPNQIAFIKINTDHNKDIAQAYQIQCWPTIFIFESGREIEKFEGANEWGIVSTVKETARKARINLAAPVSAPAAPAATPSVQSSCMHCRDFSGPDNHSARFPRESLPSQDLGWLAQQLTAPFPSHTDKARAIFTWLHHNIAYDVVSFFGNNVKPSTPQNTLASGLAVCEGYAGLFAALAMKAGMEAVVVGGDGKGFGYTELQPGQPIPPQTSNHAWNAVRIDGGAWKLIDACWGAGIVQGAGQPYVKRFAPERFTQTNESFGLDHFPEDSSKQFRADGRRVTWPEYITGNKDGCGAHFYGGHVAEEGFDKTSFQPNAGKIVLSQQPGPTVRFSFQKICPHWDPDRNGKGPHYLYALAIEALEKDPRNHIPFETNGDVWWCDVPVRDLGKPGQKVTIMAFTSFGGKDGRGLTVQEYKRMKGKTGWGGGFMAAWEIA